MKTLRSEKGYGSRIEIPDVQNDALYTHLIGVIPGCLNQRSPDPQAPMCAFYFDLVNIQKSLGFLNGILRTRFDPYENEPDGSTLIKTHEYLCVGLRQFS